MDKKVNYGGFSKPIDLTNMPKDEYPDLKNKQVHEEFKAKKENYKPTKAKADTTQKGPKLNEKFDEEAIIEPEVDMTDVNLRRTYKVIPNALNLRHKPSQRARVRGILRKGSLIKGVPVNSEWVQIYAEGHKPLYVRIEHLSEI